MSANNDTISKTLIVTISLCVVCAVLVSAAAVGLKPRQEANKAKEIKAAVLEAAGLLKDAKSIDKIYEQNVTAKVISLETDSWNDGIDPTRYDFRKAAKDPKQSVALPGEKDVAGIKRQPTNMPVFMVKQGDKIEKVILPVYGYGLWSTMYGFIALEGDLNTVVGLTFYQQGETPGLGGEVDNPKWKALWRGKKVYKDGSDEPQLHLIKGRVDPSAKDAAYQVDGLAGATLTSRGVTNLVKFWLGENGYGPFLEKLRKGEV